MGEWMERRLRDIADLRSGHGFPEDEQGMKSGSLPFYKVSDMNSLGNEKYLSSANNYVEHKTARDNGWKILPRGAVVFAKVGAALLLNRRRILTVPSIIDNNMMAAIASKAVSTNWLYYWLLTVDFAEFVQVGALPSINQYLLGHVVVDVPPFEEQRRIAEVVDAIDETIHSTERVIAKMRHTETAVLMESIDFARDGAQLGDVCSLLQDGTHLPPQRTSSGPLLLSVQNLRDGQLQLSTRDTHVPEAFWRSTRRSLPIEPGDVCLAVVGTLGKLGVVPPDLPRFTVQRSLTVLRGHPMRMRNDYLFAVMRHGEFQRSLWQRANQTAQPGVYLGELRTVRVPSPSLDEQRRVTEILNSINETIRINKEQRDKLLQLRSGLAADLLSGRVRTVAA